MFGFGPGDRVLVIGLGRSGLASVEVLRGRGASVYATDEKNLDDLSQALATVEALGAQFVTPAEIEAAGARVTSAILSPGVPPTSPVVQALNRANVPVIGEIELAYRLCPAPIIAVTGTKGKSTTTALIGHLLRASGHSVRVGGNIGNPLIREVVGADAHEWIVAEVSSFQLETIRAFKPRIAVLLNIAPDHLDRYYSMDEYAEAKYRIVANQGLDDWFVGNLDDPRIARLHWRHGEARAQARQLWFTLGTHEERAAMFRRNGVLTYAPATGDPRPIPIVARDAIALPGEHNVANAMAALLAALAAGCAPHRLREAIASFRPMPHRLQTVAEIDGVRFVDDSKSTNPHAAIAALFSFTGPVVLIAGGRAKGTAFGELGAAIRSRAKAVVAIGEAAAEIVRVCEGVPAAIVASMEDAVRRARELSAPGDVVLLSPACASFDMFASAEDRGERFAAAVAALPEPAGA
ncbi:MAG: UDP-N-acetylmuramoyl-L-alanine--D-glutamate ligase [Candidatus Eremiobacteraeota bacterium]|nr:UDP-N-acetylmuramoyl-L-alanine--D-glutamate ligase [Candidatus Eremiobacteraeota bacterium]